MSNAALITITNTTTTNTTAMTKSELFKIAKHRTPWALLITYGVFLLAGPAYFLFQQPSEASTYLDTLSAVFAVSGLLLAPIYGAWLVGNEYRHGTLRRVLALDARRGRLLATKATLGLGTAIGCLAVAAGIGLAGTASAAAVHGDSLVLDGVVRSFLSGAFVAIVAGTIAFGLSVVLRSDTYAMLGSLSTLVVFGPILMLIPGIGNYTPFALTTQISERIEDANAVGAVSLGTAVGTLAAMLAVLSIGASRLFATRDI